MAVEQAFTGIRVLELGTRLSAGGCGSLMAQTGASVLYVNLTGYSSSVPTKHDYRALFSAGKSAALDYFNARDKELAALGQGGAQRWLQVLGRPGGFA